MAPGRRRGGKGSGGGPKTELSLGDLVLAKVKGFPAWPAKVKFVTKFLMVLFHLITEC